MSIRPLAEKILALDRPSAVMLIGLPGVGKTTVAEQIIRQAAEIDCATNVRRVSTDEIREELTRDGTIRPGYDRAQNAKIFELAHLHVRSILEIGGIALIDATHLNRFRDSTIAQYHDLGAACVAGLVISGSIELAHARNAIRHERGTAYVNPADIAKMETYRQTFPVTEEHIGNFDIVFEYAPAPYAEQHKESQDSNY